MRTTGSDVVRQFIDAYQIKYIFGNPGTTELKFLEAVQQCKHASYLLTLQESSTVGMAAGYAMITKQPAVVNLHTYAGLANGLCNIYNAYLSGIPLLIIAGQHERSYLIHKPILAGDLTGLAQTAVKYSYELLHGNDLALALERCYAQASLPAPGPVFLSIPMDIWQDEIQEIDIKKTTFLQNCVNREIDKVCEILKNTPKGKLAFVADYEVGLTNSIHLLHSIAEQLGAHVFAAPYHVREVIDPLSSNYKGRLSDKSGEVNATLKQYDTVVLLGEKIKGYLYTGEPSIPQSVQLIQMSAVTQHLSFDYSCNLAVLGDLHANLEAIHLHLKATGRYQQRKPDNDLIQLERKYVGQPVPFLIFNFLNQLDRSVHLITEGSSEDIIVQDIATQLGFFNVNFSPRGGGLGWAMPLAAGISLAIQQHSICFVGDGGSLYAIHAIWSAAKYKIPVIYICFINNAYRVLRNNTLGKQHPDEENFFHLDLDKPQIDIVQIAKSMGAQVKKISSVKDIKPAIKAGFAFKGPTFIAMYGN